jgi:hypothetical protein
MVLARVSMSVNIDKDLISLTVAYILEKQTFAKLKVRNMLVQNYLKLEIDHARAILLATYE